METTNARTLFFFGRPGSGKGTQAKRLAVDLGWQFFSTGERFREMRDGSSVLSERVKAAYDSGQLLPDWLAVYLFEEAVLPLERHEGILVDGFPRTHAQAVFADEALSWLGRRYTVFNLVVSEEEAARRQLSRAQSDPRPDSDTPEKVRFRLATYRTHTEPVLQYFKDRGLCVDIDGEQSEDAIAADIHKVLHLS
ncbi:MAG TPA: nucleoside monophosphate kinase [Candidatus Paceibacterota bacterium]